MCGIPTVVTSIPCVDSWHNAAQTLEEKSFIPQMEEWLSPYSIAKTRGHAILEAMDNHALATRKASLRPEWHMYKNWPEKIIEDHIEVTVFIFCDLALSQVF